MIDSQQFEAFMKAYQNMVFTTAVRLLGSEAEAEDVSQEVFLKAYERYAELKDSPTIGGWLKTVTRNLCLNHLSRYRARWRFFSEMAPDLDDEDASTPEWAAPDTHEQQVTAGDHRELLEAVLHKLPSAQRVPLVLYHFEEMSYEEISAKLRVSLSKVKTDIHRGREALRRKLKLKLAGEEEWGGLPGAENPCPT